jgi:hypothetical protein
MPRFIPVSVIRNARSSSRISSAVFFSRAGQKSPLLVSSAIPFRLISLAKPNGKLAGTRRALYSTFR